MFAHLLKYRLKSFLTPSAEIFWSIAFPYVLATLFYLAFSNLINSTETFEPIPVAIVKDSAADPYACSFLEHMSSSGDTKLLDSVYTTSDQAKSLLQDNSVKGILYIKDTISLTVMRTGYDESILKSVLDHYTSTSATMKEIALSHPDAMKNSIASLAGSLHANQEISLSKHQNLDTMASYFYALLAMACLFESFLGFKATVSTQANISALGARRTITPVNKLTLILSDFVACLIISYTNICILITYLAFCLHVDFGDRLPLVFLTAFVGSIVGITFGIFITSLGKGGINIKISIMISVQMISCLLGGLMVNSMMDIVEKYCPLINRINPASLISGAIYSLSIYDSYDHFFSNLALLTLLAVLLTAASFLLTRRERYASI